MRHAEKTETGRMPQDRVWWLTLSPLVWAVHFLASYLTVAIWCAKYSGEDIYAMAPRVAIGIYTMIGLAVIAYVTWASYRAHRTGDRARDGTGDGAVPHDFDSLGDQRKFMGLAS